MMPKDSDLMGRTGGQPLSGSRSSSSKRAPAFLSPTTTADSWNRLRDKERVERELGLEEHGHNQEVLVARGLPASIDVCMLLKAGLLQLGSGYRRVLYGDHGPYVELLPEQIHWPAFTRSRRKGHALAYYDEHYTANGAVQAYEQKRDVSHPLILQGKDVHALNGILAAATHARY
eukprot:1516484-Amphidinium_carterae.1